MTPKWPLTPDIFGEHVHPFPSNPVSFRWGQSDLKMMKKTYYINKQKNASFMSYEPLKMAFFYTLHVSGQSQVALIIIHGRLGWFLDMWCVIQNLKKKKKKK